MTVFEVYEFTNPHKGFGRGKTVDYVALDEDYPDKQPAQASMERDAVEAAGYETYDHGARPVSEDWLEERIGFIEDKISDLESERKAAMRAANALRAEDRLAPEPEDNVLFTAEDLENVGSFDDTN